MKRLRLMEQDQIKIYYWGWRLRIMLIIANSGFEKVINRPYYTFNGNC